MKTRIIHSRFYSSERVLGLSQQARWLYMYYLTCEGIALTGAFRWSLSRTLFETRLTKPEHESAKKELASTGSETEKPLVIFIDDWIIIPNAIERNNFRASPKTIIGYQRELESLPEGVRTCLGVSSDENTPSIVPDTSMEGVSNHFDTPNKYKTENINKKPKTTVRKSTSDEAAGSNAAHKVLQSWNEVFGTSYSSTRSLRANLTYWLEVYSLDQILESVKKARTNPFWRDKITPMILLRRKNPRQEDVDYIGDLLNYGKKPQAKIPWKKAEPVFVPDELPVATPESMERIKKITTETRAMFSRRMAA